MIKADQENSGQHQPVVEVGAVGEVFAAQLAGLSDISQAVDELRLHWVVFTQLVKVLPRLAAPVGADLLTHVPVEAEHRAATHSPSEPEPPPPEATFCLQFTQYNNTFYGFDLNATCYKR